MVALPHRIISHALEFPVTTNSFDCLRTLKVGDNHYSIYDLNAAGERGMGDPSKLPLSLKVLLENLLRFEDGVAVRPDDIDLLANWTESPTTEHEIAFHPSRVLMQDFTGVPAIADLAAMRNAMQDAGFDPEIINPLTPVDLVIDHSLMVDHFGTSKAFDANVALEVKRNRERYRFLKWGQQAFKNFKVVPPGTGICHQVNLEYLASVVATSTDGDQTFAYPDTLVGTDSHTTMINGLGVLGWGVGGIEAEAAMLGQPLTMLLPRVVGVRLTGSLSEGITATDLVLRIVEILRQTGVVGAFVEFYGPALNELSLADRATISNMAPEYGSSCGFFPIDDETLNYLRLTSRPQETIDRVEVYAKHQGLWRDDSVKPSFSGNIELNLGTIEPSVAGPKRPQDRIPIKRLLSAFDRMMDTHGSRVPMSRSRMRSADDHKLEDGDVVIAAITSCTNTSNPAVMLGAGLVAKKAHERGLSVKPWVKTSLAPGSKVVTEYLERTGLQKYLDEIGFDLVGYGCTTCIGNSGPLSPEISRQISDGNLVVSSVLSGNRNFEGRVHQEVRANWLASPPLVVAYAIAGTTRINLHETSLGKDPKGRHVYLHHIWPTRDEIKELMDQVSSDMFQQQYADLFKGPVSWKDIESEHGPTYSWSESTYIKHPPFFTNQSSHYQSVEVHDASILAILGDMVTTDHISPAGAIHPKNPAGQYLQELGVEPADFNSYGARRGNHEVMMRGTFANVRIRNEMVPDLEGGFTVHVPSQETTSIYDAAMRYAASKTPLVVIAGSEYGTGSSRDWAAKGTALLGVKAVIAQSYERIHRSNLIGMGVLPLQLVGMRPDILELTGHEKITIQLEPGEKEIKPRQRLVMTIRYTNGSTQVVILLSRIDTKNEVHYFQSGGILPYVLGQLMQKASNPKK